MFASTVSLHISGFLAGEKPSRNHASTHASGNCGNASSTSSITSVSRTRPPRKAPAVPARHAAMPARQQRFRLALQFRPQRQCGAQFVIVQGNFSTLKKSRLAPAGATCSNNCHAQRKFSPVPKPVSPMQKLSPADSAAKRSANWLPCRNTWRVSSRPESVEKYTSP